MVSTRARSVLIAVVTTVWAGNFLASVFVSGYQTSEAINGIFMIVVGGLFTIGIHRSNRDGEDQ